MFRLHSSVWRQCGTARTVSSTLSTHPDCENRRDQAVVAVSLPCFTGTTATMSHGSVALAGIESVTDYCCNTQSLCAEEATQENTV